MAYSEEIKKIRQRRLLAENLVFHFHLLTDGKVEKVNLICLL